VAAEVKPEEEAKEAEEEMSTAAPVLKEVPHTTLSAHSPADQTRRSTGRRLTHCDGHQLSAKELAQQLTLADFKTFSRISPSEVLPP
jgi:hypothetical protein